MCVLVLACATLASCNIYYVLLGSLFYEFDTHMGDVIITMTLRDASEPLTYHQPHMAGAAVGAVEWTWGVRIDVDADASTGDPDGFDVTLVAKLQTGGATADPVEASLRDVLAAADVTPPIGGYPYSADELEYEELESRQVGLSGATIYIGARANEDDVWAYPSDVYDFLSLPQNYRAQFFTLCNNPPDPGTVIGDTAELVGNGTASDPEDAALPGCLDIVEVRMEHPGRSY